MTVDIKADGLTITAENITDEQIRELHESILLEGARGEYAYNVPSIEATAQLALGRSELRRVARARCAEILEARRSKP